MYGAVDAEDGGAGGGRSCEDINRDLAAARQQGAEAAIAALQGELAAQQCPRDNAAPGLFDTIMFLVEILCQSIVM